MWLRKAAQLSILGHDGSGRNEAWTYLRSVRLYKLHQKGTGTLS